MRPNAHSARQSGVTIVRASTWNRIGGGSAALLRSIALAAIALVRGYARGARSAKLRRGNVLGDARWAAKWLQIPKMGACDTTERGLARPQQGTKRLNFEFKIG